jgi:hypothetical protein
MWSAATVVVCALELLGRSAGTFPPIIPIDVPPSDASQHVEAFVRLPDTTIYLIASSRTFRAAQAAVHRCGNREAVRKIASVLVHEEWHVRHGADERGAYEAQLMALMTMGAGQDSTLYYDVSRSMRAVTARRPRAALAVTRSPGTPQRRSGRLAPP